MGLLGALFERYHSLNFDKAVKVTRAVMEYYWLLEKDKPRIPDCVRVFLACYIALELIPADGDTVVSNEKLAAEVTFTDGVANKIVQAAIVTGSGRGHIRSEKNPKEFQEFVMKCWKVHIPQWKLEMQRTGKPAVADVGFYWSMEWKVKQLISRLCK